MTIVIGPDGNVTMIASAEAERFIQMGEGVRKRRASHVEPVSLSLRILFRIIRKVTGETGVASEWTRRWSVQWRVDLRPSRGPVFGRFVDRAAAIRAEVEWLESNGFGRVNV